MLNAGGRTMRAMDGIDDVPRLIHEIGGHQHALTSEVEVRLRRHFGERVLPHRVSAYTERKYHVHVADNREWPDDTSPEEYLESLRSVVFSNRGGILLEYSDEDDDWTVWFVGRSGRATRGPASGGWIVVLFNASRSLWVTGFQPERGLAYVGDRSGFWIRHVH